MTDFLKNFTDFEVCSVSVDMLYEDENGGLCVCVCGGGGGAVEHVCVAF